MRRLKGRPVAGLALAGALLGGAIPAIVWPEAPLPLADDLDGALGAIWQLHRVRSDGLAFVTDPTGAPRRVLAITLKPGDMAGDGGGTERAELSEANAVHLPTGTDVWYAFSLYLPPDFPVQDRRLVIGQWKQDCGDCVAAHSPAVANRYRGGVFAITIDTAAGRRTLFEDRAEFRGRWHRLVYRLRIVPSPDGLLRAWLDARPVVDYQGPLGFADDRDSVYFKIGLYRDPLGVPMTLLVAGFRRGSSRAQVDFESAARPVGVEGQASPVARPVSIGGAGP